MGNYMYAITMIFKLVIIIIMSTLISVNDHMHNNHLKVWVIVTRIGTKCMYVEQDNMAIWRLILILENLIIENSCDNYRVCLGNICHWKVSPKDL